jgi:hypothetical protein
MEINNKLEVNDIIYALVESCLTNENGEGQESYSPVKGVINKIEETKTTLYVYLDLVDEEGKSTFEGCAPIKVYVFKKDGKLENLYCPYGEGIFKTKEELFLHLEKRVG